VKRSGTLGLHPDQDLAPRMAATKTLEGTQSDSCNCRAGHEERWPGLNPALYAFEESARMTNDDGQSAIPLRINEISRPEIPA
jgi:hypothetical protein